MREGTLTASMADMQDRNGTAVDGEQNPVHMGPAAIEQVPHLKRGIGVSGASGQRAGEVASDAIASSSARNHRIPVSPACCEYNHSSMASASCSDSGVVSTRKTIFSAHLGKELSGGASASRPHVLTAPPDAFDGFPIIGAFPFEIRGQSLIKRVGQVLTVPLGIVVELRLTFRLDGYYVHAPKGKGSNGSCQGAVGGVG